MNKLSHYCHTCMDRYAYNNHIKQEEAAQKFTKAERGSGDWVVLIPDQESANKLERIAALTKQSIARLTEIHNPIEPYSASRMHLSVSSPLKLLSIEQSKNLLENIKKVIPDGLNFNSKMEKGLWTKNYDVFKFQFTGINYQPYVTLTSTQVADQNSTLSKLMKEVNTLSDREGLLNEGTSNHRRPHITIGQVNDPSLVKVHRTFFNCMEEKMRWEQHDEVIKDNVQSPNSTHISINFSEAAILRVIREEGKPARYYKIGSLSLDNGRTVTVYDNPRPWGTNNISDLAEKLETLAIKASPQEEALKLVKKFEGVEINDGFKESFFDLREAGDGSFIITENDFVAGDSDYYTGKQLNEKYQDKRGSFDFIQALKNPSQP